MAKKKVEKVEEPVKEEQTETEEVKTDENETTTPKRRYSVRTQRQRPEKNTQKQNK